MSRPSPAALVIATPLGLLVAKVQVVRAAIGPLLSGLQSLPSVAWVPAAILWFGLTDAQQAEVYPYEDWQLAKSSVPLPPEGTFEDDLFAGLREPAQQSKAS